MKRFIKYLLILPLLAAVAACTREHRLDVGPDTGAGEKNVMFHVAVPVVAPQGDATRAIGATQENSIETLDILAFKVEGGIETFLYWADASRSTGSSDGVPMQSFAAKVRVKDFGQRFVLITNARDKIQTLLGSRLDGWVGQEKEVLLSKLTVDLDGGDRWKAVDASNYTAIPMWGETQPITVAATTASIGTVTLLRMVAKIEVQLDQSVAGLTGAFKLRSVNVYNTNTSGRVVPKPGTDYIDANTVAQKPSLPASVATSVGPLAYTDFTAPGIPDIAMRGAIYLFETAAKNAGNFLQETCIVVGGLYGTDTAPSYYRLDFFAPDGTTYLDMLRNNRYICNIVEVKGRGYPSVDDAWRSKSFNMVANILVWNEGAGDVVFDDQHMLSVNQGYFDLTGDAHTAAGTDNILTVTTNYPTGWTASVWADKAGTTPVPNDPVTGTKWLSITSTSGAGNGQPADVRLVMPASTAADRTAYVLIKAGRLTYVVTVLQRKQLPGTIEFTPNNMLLPYTIPAGAQYAVTVTCKKYDGTDDPNANWTLTSADASWLRLSTSPTTAFSSATASISGTGSTTLYTIAADNPDINPRATTIYTGTSSSDVVTTVTQWGNPDTGGITDNEGAGTPPTNVISYVGAFWKASQTGERVIRIDMSGNAANYGTWSAKVIWLDSRWGVNDGVVLSTDKLPGTTGADPNIYTATPGDAENYQVGGYSLVATGNASAANKYVTFRIGLRTPFTAYDKDTNPARYAIVLFSYANETKYQKIFLRQGEGADYLMTNADAVSTGSLTKRTACVKFSPYNLTAATLDARVDISGATPAVNAGTFTDYPTKAGALFEWANTYTGTTWMGIRWGMNPYTSAPANTWSPSDPPITTYWNTLAANHETCPSGYRRPTDGSITAVEAGTNISNSEYRQSIFSKPQTGLNYASSTANGLWGYYADGFFDRRQIVNGSGTGATNTTVSATTRDIAHIGVIFFNPTAGSDHYNASLFFPAAGERYYNTGTLTGSGSMSLYWSSSQNPNGTVAAGIGMIFRSGSLGPWRIETATGVSIRCVKVP